MVANTFSSPMGELAQRSGSIDQIADRTAVVVLAIVAVIAALTFRDYGLGWDDFTHAQYGDLLLSFYGSGFADKRALSFVNLYMYGGGFDMAAALIAKLLPFDLFETRRLVGAMVGTIGLVATWRTARRLGGPVAGTLALMLLATAPLFFGHMFMNPKDAPFAVAMILLVLGLVRGCEEYPRLGVATAAILAAGFGLSVGTRIMGVFGIIYGVAALAMIFGTETYRDGVAAAAPRLGRFVLALIPVVVVAYALMALVWPWSVIDPLNPYRAVTYFSVFFEKPWKEMFDGALVSVPDMPRSYVPTLFVLQTPTLMLTLAAVGMVGAAVALVRSSLALQWRAALLVVVFAAVAPIVVTVIERPAVYNGIRHFVFVIPPLAVLGGLAGAWLIERASRLGGSVVAVALGMLAIGFLSPIVELVRLHPYQYTFFNRIAGGIKGADERYMLDYWGLAFKQASEELRAKLAETHEQPPGRRRWRIAVCGPHAPAEVALGSQFLPTWDPKGADFAMVLGEFYCAAIDAPVLVEVEREGVVYARVYDIRGRTVSSMFTIPPVERDDKK